MDKSSPLKMASPVRRAATVALIAGVLGGLGATLASPLIGLFPDSRTWLAPVVVALILAALVLALMLVPRFSGGKR
jgi:hypothetical protein